MRGESRTVGRPYYDFFLRSFGLPLLLLMGIGPLIAWRRASLRSLGRTFLWPAGVARRHRRRPDRCSAPARRRPGLIAYTFSAFVLASIVLEFVRGTPRRRARSRRSSAATGGATAATSCTRRSSCSRSASPARARTDSSASGSSRPGSRSRSPATRSRIARSRSSAARTTSPFARRSTSRAAASTSRASEPGKNRYFAEQQVSNEMAIYTDWLRAEDVDVIADQIDPGGAIYFEGARQAARQSDLARRASSSSPARSSRCGRTRASSAASRALRARRDA